ncbi:hypothetical protein QE385_001901 [Sphingomonas sp. SORGH_AS 950]|nr:hypothetical protein [Sphingomonas sp. SORGH_AS_0950]
MQKKAPSRPEQGRRLRIGSACDQNFWRRPIMSEVDELFSL